MGNVDCFEVDLLSELGIRCIFIDESGSFVEDMAKVEHERVEKFFGEEGFDDQLDCLVVFKLRNDIVQDFDSSYSGFLFVFFTEVIDVEESACDVGQEVEYCLEKLV